MKNKPLEVSSSLVNEKVKFECKTPGRESIFVDYTPPAGDGEGFTSLELLLASISTCIGTTARVLIENRLGKKISKLDIYARGERRDEHPTYLEKIEIDMDITSQGLDEDAVVKIMEYGRKTICPVINMIGSNVNIDIRYRVLEKEVTRA